MTFSTRSTFPQTQRPAVQEERLRIHHRRAGLHSRGLQQRPQQDLLLLVAGVAARPRSGQSGQRDRAVAGRTRRQFQRPLFPTAGLIDPANFPDCPVDPGTGQRFPANIVPVDTRSTRPRWRPKFRNLRQGRNTWNGCSHPAHQLARRIVSRRPQFYRQNSRHFPLYPRLLGPDLSHAACGPTEPAFPRSRPSLAAPASAWWRA